MATGKSWQNYSANKNRRQCSIKPTECMLCRNGRGHFLQRASYHTVIASIKRLHHFQPLQLMHITRWTWTSRKTSSEHRGETPFSVLLLRQTEETNACVPQPKKCRKILFFRHALYIETWELILRMSIKPRTADHNIASWISKLFFYIFLIVHYKTHHAWCATFA